MRGLKAALAERPDVDRAFIDDAADDVDELRKRLVPSGRISDEEFARTVSIVAGLPIFPLVDTTLDPDVVALIPGSLCRRYRVIPVARYRGSVVLGMVDPTDLIALDDVASATDLRVDPVVVSAEALNTAFDRYLRSDDELVDLSQEISETAGVRQPAASGPQPADDETEAPVIRFVNLLIQQAINDRASDIHLEPGEHRLTVRFRIDGVMHVMQQAARNIQDGVISRLKIMAALDIAEKRRPQDGRLSVRHEGRTVDVRVATLPTVWGEKVVMRILDNTGQALTMTDMDLSPINQQRLSEALARPHGMILVTGPTGSGKSTTLYAALRTVVSPRINVITVEDPVEYRVEGVNQVQVNHRAGLNFQGALRSILRSDPDVILVGEIRDAETATMSIEAALTGHLLLSTLHTNDAPGALTRLVEMGAEPYLVATASQLLVAQRLARRLCNKCAAPLENAGELLAGFGLGDVDTSRVRRAVGCPACSGTGYRGRIALHEVMTVSTDAEAALVSGAAGSKLRELAVAEGMVPLRQDGWEKVLAGHTTIEEVLRVSV